ncbi:MAG: YihY/virulence factor BrkB family protein [Phreatobacter sp.]|uniref:YihY/virulence factor BrkB family protein n=1 Tax=Phreatobacter sp. TaxID=1966341 RepID=UPI004035DAA9
MHPLLRSLLIILASALGAAAAVRLTLPSPASRVTKDSAPAEAALESGRGRHARGIGEITAAGWKDVLWRTAGEVSDDRVAAVAGGVVFFALMAIFPAIAALVSLAGLFSDRGAIAGDIAQLVGFLPDGLRTLILDEVDRHVAQDDAALGLTLAVGLGFALWSANAGTKAVIEALNVAYGEREKRSFLYLNLISLTLTFGALGLALAALWLVVAIPILIDALGSELLRQAIALARWPVIAAVATLAFAVLYRYAPSRRPPQWRWVWLGALGAAAAWLAGSALFSLYISRFSDFDATYGPLGGLIAGLLWLWVSVIALLMGAEFNAETERQTLRDTTEGAPRPMGAREARAADTVGASTA